DTPRLAAPNYTANDFGSHERRAGPVRDHIERLRTGRTTARERAAGGPQGRYRPRIELPLEGGRRDRRQRQRAAHVSRSHAWRTTSAARCNASCSAETPATGAL